jgi:uncharacterized protein (TIGR00369 family)
MHMQNPEYVAQAEQLFTRAAFVQDLGLRLTAVHLGDCTAELTLGSRHMQQDGFAHAGVIATLADHTAGAAAVTLVRADQTILSVDYAIHLLRPAVGTALLCRAQVLRQGRTLIVVESEVSCADRLVAKATVTLAVVDARRLEAPR